MANEIALVTTSPWERVEIVEAWQTLPLIAGEAIKAGAGVRIDTSTGKATNANGSTEAEARVVGIATRTAAAGEALTVLKQGILDGFTLTGDYDADVFLSDTDGRLSHVAGTVETVIGRVIGGHATTLGTAADKLLLVEVGHVGPQGPQGEAG